MESSNPQEKKRIAPSRKEGALKPRCCSLERLVNAWERQTLIWHGFGFGKTVSHREHRENTKILTDSALEHPGNA